MDVGIFMLTVLVSVAVIFIVYFLFAVIICVDKEKDFNVNLLEMIACGVALLFSMYKLFDDASYVKDGAIDYVAVSTVILSVVTLQKNIISIRKDLKKKKNRKRNM